MFTHKNHQFLLRITTWEDTSCQDANKDCLDFLLNSVPRSSFPPVHLFILKAVKDPATQSNEVHVIMYWWYLSSISQSIHILWQMTKCEYSWLCSIYQNKSCFRLFLPSNCQQISELFLSLKSFYSRLTVKTCKAMLSMVNFCPLMAGALNNTTQVVQKIIQKEIN